MTPTITAFERSPDRGQGLARDMRVRWALEEVGQPYASSRGFPDNPGAAAQAGRAGRSERVMMNKFQVKNVNHPGSVKLVDADMYKAMKRAYLAVLPASAPGLTILEIQERLIAHLPQDLYPDSAKAGWWAKTVQLDLEARAIIKRVETSPLRLHRA